MSQSVCKKLWVLILGFLVPGLAFAANINPLHGNSWDLYVFGNGRVIYDVLMSIKMLMVPDKGSSGFNTLLILLATIGFVVLAVQAGFDPARNLLRMFFYIFIAWGVSLTSTKLTANITVQDKVTGYVNSVSDVPFIVGVPAALVSQVGEYFRRSLETYFTTPDELKLEKGQFNLFGKMLDESNQYVFKDAQLRNSFRAYISDCTIPAMAAGKLVGTADGPNGPEQVTGVDALLKSNNLMATLESASTNKGILTKFYPSLNETGGIDSDSQTGPVASALKELTDSGYSAKYAVGQGILLNCSDAYAALKAGVEKQANLLVDAGSKAWSKTGIQVTLEAAHNSVISTVAGGMGTPGRFTQFASPSTFVQQQAIMGLLSGSFTQAAVQTGNNEALTATLVAQAEQAQKSSYATAFTVFNNMMGYIYTVLQAFIFAITPLVVVALLIPGMGRSIFANYAQIQVWLTLWMPMLAIVNYLITLFGAEQVGNLWAQTGGPTLSNRALVSEKTNDLMLAAQFLGTMTPLITWGIVKGALAFTEFIQNGIGSSFAKAAGEQAASGSMSMGNLNMANTSMNKLGTAFESSVGFKSTTGYLNAAVGDTVQARGGTNVLGNGSGESSSVSHRFTKAQMMQIGESVTHAINEVKNENMTYSQGRDYAFKHGGEAGRQLYDQFTTGVTDAKTTNNSSTKTDSADHTLGANLTLGRTDAVTSEKALQASLGLSGGKVLSGGIGVSGRTADATSFNMGISGDDRYSLGQGLSLQQGANSSMTGTLGATSGISYTGGTSAGYTNTAHEGTSYQQQKTMSDALTQAQSWTRQISESQQTEFVMSWSRANDMAASNAARDAALLQDEKFGAALTGVSPASLRDTHLHHSPVNTGHVPSAAEVRRGVDTVRNTAMGEYVDNLKHADAKVGEKQATHVRQQADERTATIVAEKESAGRQAVAQKGRAQTASQNRESGGIRWKGDTPQTKY